MIIWLEHCLAHQHMLLKLASIMASPPISDSHCTKSGSVSDILPQLGSANIFIIKQMSRSVKLVQVPPPTSPTTGIKRKPVSRAFLERRWCWDVFICHAGEDKVFARMLYEELRRRGVRCFVDEDSLRVGCNAPQEMKSASERTHIAVVLLCEEFFQKDAPKQELRGFLRAFKRADNVVIPVFFKATVEECEALAKAEGLEAVTGCTGVRHHRECDRQTGEPVHEEETMHRIIEEVCRLSCLPTDV